MPCGCPKGYKRSEESKQNYKNSWTLKRKNEKRKLLKKHNPMHKKAVKDKLKTTCVERYGVENYSQTKQFKLFISKNNAMNNPENIKKIAQTKLKHYGSTTYNNTKKYKKTCRKKYGVDNVMQNKTIKERAIDTYTKRLANGEYTISSNRWKTGWYVKKDGTKEWFDSSFEQKRMQQLDSMGVTWTKKHKIRIPYIYNKIKTYYVPDFLINNTIIEEVKGWMTKEVKLKAKAAKKFCKIHGYTYRFLLGKELKECII